MRGVLRIQELADRAGVSTQTVRRLEKRGLLPPPRRDVNGWRAYEPEDVARLLKVILPDTGKD
jgi:DNA-binding transcriptional MerR regulator